MRVLSLALIAVLVMCGAVYGQGETAGSIISFPQFNAAPGVGSGIALFNPTTAEAPVSITAFRPDGTQLGPPTNVTVPPLGQLTRTQDQLFGPGDLQSSLQVTSPANGLVAFVETFDGEGTFMDGSAGSNAALQLVFPVIPGTAPDQTRISLLNRNTRATRVRLRLLGLGGELIGESFGSVSPNGVFSNSIRNIFRGVTDFSTASHVMAVSSPRNLFFAPQTLSGTSSFSGPPSLSGTFDFAALNALTLTETATAGAIPLFRVNRENASTLSIANIEPVASALSVTAMAADGSVLGTANLNVPASGGVRMPVQELFPGVAFTDRRGWLLLQSNGRITAANIFGRPETGAFSAIALQPLPEVSFAFPQIVQGFGFSTEIVLANPGPEAGTATLFLIHPEGTTTASAAVLIPPGAQFSGQIDEIFPGLPETGGGIVFVRSTTPIFGTATLWTDSGKVAANFGPQPVPDNYEPGPVVGIVVPGTQIQLSGITPSREIIEGSPAATLTLDGAGFLEGSIVRIAGSSDGIGVNRVSDTQIVAQVPASYFEQAGIFPVVVQGTTGQSNVQFLTVYHPRPALERISPDTVPERLEDSSRPLTLTVEGYGFRRGAVVLFEDTPVPTAYCERTPACLAEELTATIDAGLLRSSGFKRVSVKNPEPSVEPSQILYLRVESLQPTITSVLPGSATVLDLPTQYELPVVVFGTNFDPNASVRFRKIGGVFTAFATAKEVVSSNQLVATLPITYPGSIGEWEVQVMNPQPGGGLSNSRSFVITEGTFDQNPFITEISPSSVAAGGPTFTLTIDGTNFQPDSQVNFYSHPVPTTFVSDTQLTAEIDESLIVIPGKKPVTVTNSDNGGTSNKEYVRVE